MKRRFFKRATALLIALVTVMSLVTVSFAGKTATFFDPAVIFLMP